MSAEATGWVYRHSPFKGLAFTVHLAVADSVNDQHDNEFFMSVASLARKVRCERKRASDAIAALTDGGWLDLVDERPGRTSRYRFVYLGDVPVVYESRRTRAPGAHPPGLSGLTHPGSESPALPVSEPKVDPKVEELPSQAGQAGGDQRAVWDAIRVAVGWGALLTRSDSARLGRVARELRTVGATAALVADFADDYRAHWPGLDLTPEAMLKHWSSWAGGQFTPQRRSKPTTAADRAMSVAIQDWRARNGQSDSDGGGGGAGRVVPALPHRRSDDPELGGGVREAPPGDR